MRRAAALLALGLFAAGCGGSSSSGSQAENGPIVLAGFTSGGSKPGLFLREPDGTIKRLTSNTDSRDVGPSWSHDGEHIAYVHQMKGMQDGTGKLMVVNRDGSDAHQVGNTVAAVGHVSWSPDDDALAYNGALKAGIWTVGADGSGAKLIYADGLEPSWSKDDRIVATRPPQGLVVMNPDGTEVQQLVRAKQPPKALLPDSYFAPSWSPDGKHIAYARKVWILDPQTLLGPASIETVDADGSNPRVVTKVLDAESTDFSWSPDGKLIAYTDSQTVLIGLFSIPVEGGTPKNLIPTAYYYMPSWGPAGT